MQGMSILPSAPRCSVTAAARPLAVGTGQSACLTGAGMRVIPQRRIPAVPHTFASWPHFYWTTDPCSRVTPPSDFFPLTRNSVDTSVTFQIEVVWKCQSACVNGQGSVCLPGWSD